MSTRRHFLCALDKDDEIVAMLLAQASTRQRADFMTKHVDRGLFNKRATRRNTMFASHTGEFLANICFDLVRLWKSTDKPVSLP